MSQILVFYPYATKQQLGGTVFVSLFQTQPPLGPKTQHGYCHNANTEALKQDFTHYIMVVLAGIAGIKGGREFFLPAVAKCLLAGGRLIVVVFPFQYKAP